VNAPLRGRSSRLAALVLALGLTTFVRLGGAAPGAPSHEERMKGWAAQLERGQQEPVLAALERDLATDDPHPDASYGWVLLHYERGDLAQAVDKLPPGRTKDRLVEMAWVYQHYKDGAYLAVVDRYAAKRWSRTDDFSVARYVMFSAAGARAAEVEGRALERMAMDGSFIAVEQALTMLDGTAERRKQALAFARREPNYGGADGGRMLEAAASSAKLDVAFGLWMTERWLEKRPDDARAHWYRAAKQWEIERPGPAVDSERKGASLNPWRALSNIGVAALLRQGKADEALALSRLTATRLHPAASRREQTELVLAVGHRIEGNYAEARRVLEALLDENPESPEPLAELIDLTLLEDRPGIARDLCKRYRALPGIGPAEIERCAEAARRDGDLDEVVKLHESLAKDREIPGGLVWELSETYLKRGQFEQALALTGPVMRRQPANWLGDQHASVLRAAGRKESAREFLAKYQALAPRSSYSVRSLVEWTAEDESDGARADEVLDGLLARDPTQAYYWELAAERASDRAAKIALYRRAADKNPNAAWPVVKLSDLFVEEREFAEALAVLDQRRPRLLEPALVGQLDDLEYQAGWVLARKREVGPLTPADVQRFERIIDDGKKRDLYRAAWITWIEARYLSEQKGDLVGAKERLREAWRLRPDIVPWPPCSSWQVSDGMDRDCSRALYRRWARRPYDLDAMNWMSEWHSRWHGSPIVALYLAEWARRYHAPALAKIGELEAIAYSGLGDYARRYRSYDGDPSIWGSRRYVGWYESTRRKAQQGNVDVKVSWRENDPTVILTNPDGTTNERKASLEFGVITEVAAGGAFTRYSYDQDGQLTRAESSSGRSVKLTWDARGRIDSVARDLGTVFRLVHDAEGNVEKVEPAGAAGAHMGDVFAELQQLLRDAATGVPSSLLDGKDAQADQLRAAYQKAKVQSPVAESRAGLSLARHLARNVARDGDYAREAEAVLEELIGSALEAQPVAGDLALGALETLDGIWHETRRQGLGLSQLELRAGTIAALWAVGEADPGASAWLGRLRKLDGDGGELLRQAAWLPKSYLSMDGYWRHHRHAALFPEGVGQPTITALSRAGQGRFALGTERGLLVHSAGSFRWFGIDPATNQLTRDPSLGQDSPAATVTALAEDNQGLLWVGSEGGLYVVDPVAMTVKASFRTPGDGLPGASTVITGLAPSKNGVLLATRDGVRRATLQGLQPVDARVDALAALSLSQPPEAVEGKDPLLVGTAEGTYWVDLAGSAPAVLVSAHAEHARFLPDSSAVAYVEAGALRLRGVTAGGLAPSRLFPDSGRIQKQKQIEGLGYLRRDDGSLALTVLTDMGMNVFADSHFEYLRVPGFDKNPAVRSIGQVGGSTVVVSSDAVSVIEKAQVQHELHLDVVAIEAVDELGVVLIADRGRGLRVMKQGEAAAGSSRLQYGSVEHMVKDADGGIIYNDGADIMRIDPLDGPGALSDPVLLFRAQQCEEAPQLVDSASVTSIVAARDGSVWVSTLSSVFRWRAGVVQEYNAFRDIAAFPIHTDWISRVVETHDGKIWVIGSDEGHRIVDGILLEGGVVEFDGKGFKRLDLPQQSGHWFAWNYTKIAPDEAIVSTLAGFARHRGERLQDFDKDLESPSYRALLTRSPSQFLGTRGVALSESTWLFGAVSGLVVYSDGQWMSASRLNWMLPQPEMTETGGRYVQALARDRSGRIYAGTSLGLLVYDPEGAADAGFLLSNTDSEGYGPILSKLDVERQSEEVDVLLKGASRDPEVKALLDDLKRAERDVAKLKAELRPGARLQSPRGKERTSDEGTPAKAFDRDASEKRMKESEILVSKILQKLKAKNPAAHRLLQLKPEDLTAMRKRLGDGQVVVQYIPTKHQLYIQISSRERTTVREVQVTAAEITLDARIVAEGLGPVTASASDEGKAKTPAPKPSEVQDALHRLYAKLLDPIADELSYYEDIFISANGPLSYVPFGALIERPGKDPRYAIQKYSIGYVPSLFMLNLALTAPEGRLLDGLVLGDPDGSLPGAKAEAADVARVMGISSRPMLGRSATEAELERRAPEASFLHLATHALLDPDRPEESYVLMAGKGKLEVAEAMNLDLSAANFVMLSACETARGPKDGLEYAALADAFAHAGAPSVIATLWQIDDDASRELVLHFYKNVRAGMSRFSAMAEAQRKLIGSKHFSAPSDWAGYIVMGRP